MKTAMQEWSEWLKAYEYELPLELQIKAKELLASELKYTEEDVYKAFKFYAYAHINQQPDSFEKLEKDYLKFINSINK